MGFLPKSAFENFLKTKEINVNPYEDTKKLRIVIPSDKDKSKFDQDFLNSIYKILASR